jgi:hypothetical protein
MHDPQLKELTGGVGCNLDFITPEQTYLQITASVKPDTDIKKVKQRIRQLINQLKQPAYKVQIAMAAPTLSMQFSSPMDVKMIMQQQPAGTSETMIVGSIGLQWGMREYQYGEPYLSLRVRLLTSPLLMLSMSLIGI